jgi:acetate kinase
MASTDTIDFLVSRVALFKDFPRPQLEALIKDSRVTSFEPHEAIIEFGEEGRFLGVILDGEAEVSVTADGGEIHQIALLKTGDVFGEMALMTGDRAMADVVGVSRCKVLIISHDLFSSILMAHPPPLRALSKRLSERSR